ncbi:MAG: hypothetical protein ACQEV6_01425 [Pseudomonadota bacterium]
MTGSEKAPGAYALVCPGVALTVMVHFFINAGLVGFGALDQFSAAYWSLSALALVPQALTIWLIYRLNRLHFGMG